MQTDRYDNALTTDSAVARDAYVAGTDAILAATAGPEQVLQHAIDADPGFALPHAAMARLHQLMGRSGEARDAAERACELAESASERERQHAEIFRLMVSGQASEAYDLTREHVQTWPRDAFVLAPSCGVFGLVGFSGRVNREPEQLALLAPLAEHYGEDWWFLSAHAFALLEMGQWQRARDMVERSLEQFSRNAHAAHIKAHALYEGGEDAVSRDYLEAWLPEYSSAGVLHCHLWWHLCLMRMVAGDVEGMWRGYDEHCAPAVSTSPAINIMSDGAALLWRAELAGYPRSLERWRAMREYYEATFPKPMVFIDAHGGMPYAALGDDGGLQRHVQAVEALAAAGRLPAGDVGARLSRGFDAYARGDYAGAIALLEAVMPEVVRIGGSRAQRDLVGQTLMSAYIKDGRVEHARAMVSAMQDRTPSIAVAGLR
jgi:pentatricopeptide repeat protein